MSWSTSCNSSPLALSLTLSSYASAHLQPLQAPSRCTLCLPTMSMSPTPRSRPRGAPLWGASRHLRGTLRSPAAFDRTTSAVAPHRRHRLPHRHADWLGSPLRTSGLADDPSSTLDRGICRFSVSSGVVPLLQGLLRDGGILRGTNQHSRTCLVARHAAVDLLQQFNTSIFMLWRCLNHRWNWCAAIRSSEGECSVTPPSSH
jgi:hypothetical protein